MIKSIRSRFVNLMFIAFSLAVASCGGGGGDGGGGGGGGGTTDGTPNAFTFTDLIDVDPNTLVLSDSITITSINIAATITVTGGEYAINGGAFTATSGTVQNTETVVVRQTSSANFQAATDATLTVGGVSDTFTVTTRGNIPPQAVSESHDVYAGSYILRQSVANDPDNEPLFFELLSNTQNGVLTFASNGTFIYRPNQGFVGTDEFSYQVSDALQIPSSATITLDVLAAPAGAILDLRANGLTLDALAAIWTSVSDTTANYDIRYSGQVLTEDNWQQATIFSHSISPAPSGEPEEFLADNLEQDTIFFFAIRQVDALGVLGPLSNVLYAKTVPTPFVSIDTTNAGPLSVEQNQGEQRSFSILNDGLLDLHFNLEILSNPNASDVPQDPKPLNYLKLAKGARDNRSGDVVAQGFGGPDNFGYEWRDSNEVGGPEFIWTDISATGTLVENLVDDNVVGPFSIGFDFKFYGETQNNFYIGSNGFVTFSDTFNHGCCSGQPIPQFDVVNYMIAWLWRDLHPRNGQVYYQVFDGERLVIQFSDYGEFCCTGEVTAQVILHADGDIKLQYLRLANGIGQQPSSIGIENADASDGLQVAFNTQYLEENLAVHLTAFNTPSWVSVDEFEGSVVPGQTQNIPLEFTGSVSPGDYTATLFLRHNSLYQDPMEMPLSLEITDDVTPPPAISTLGASSPNFDKVRLTWQAVGDAGIVAPPLASYDIRYSLALIDESNWGSTIPLANVPVPAAAGTVQDLLVTELTAETLYYFAMKGADQVGHISALSNVLPITTLGPPVVNIPIDSIDIELREGRTSATPFQIANTGESELTYSISLREIQQAIAASVAKLKPAPQLLQSRKPRVISELPTRGSYVPNELIVRFEPQAEANTLQSILHLQYDALLINRIDALNMQVWRINDESTLLETIQRLNQRPDVVFAEPNYRVIANEIPDDALFSQLWGLHNMGQTGGTIDADIDAVEAWDISTGSSDVVVAIIDSGIDYTHPDLVDNLWINEDEIAGNGIDDDGNGYVDDVYGYDFANNDGDPFDDNNHGTHVAGTVGAVGNNGLGVVGVSHQVALMGVKFLDSSGSGFTSTAVESVVYAVDNGAVIQSNSWGGGGFAESLRAAIEYAHQNDVLFVAAAGNDGTDNDIAPHYPSSYEVDNVVAVAATDHNDQLASFSQYGLLSVDLGAPGVNIVSSVPGGNYSSFNGTSMATPHVSGVAALLKAHAPGLSNLEIKQILFDSTDPLPSLESRTVTGGRLNVLEALESTVPSWITLPPELISGTVAPGETLELFLEIDTTDLAPGTYVVEIVIQTNDPVTPEVTILLTLTVLPDIEAPSAITDFAVSDVTDTRARLTFTATGDDGLLGQARQYDVRFSTSDLNEGNWDDATSASGLVPPAESGTPEDFVVSSLLANSTLFIAVRAIDNVGLISDLSNVVQITTLNAELQITPEEIPPTVSLPGETHDIVLTLRNIGQVDLNIVANVSPNNAGTSLASTQHLASRDIAKGEIDYRVGPPVLLGSGGPDDFGYVWADSNEPGGPSFTWTDISTTGTLIGGLVDDNVVGPIDIAFPFPFYGQDQNQLFISDNGFITFDSDAFHGCCTGQPIPSDDFNNHLIAWMWHDLHPRSSTVHYEHFDNSSIVIQFTNYGEFAGSGTVDAQVQLNASGEVIFRYNQFLNNMDNDSASIGIENQAGDIGLQVAFNTTYLEDGLAISLAPHWLSSDTGDLTLAPNAEAQIILTIDTQNLAVGDYESFFIIQSNDSTRPQIVLPVSLQVIP